MIVAYHRLAAAFRYKNMSALQVLINHKKPISHLRPWMNVERLLVYIDAVVRNVTICVLSYGYGTTSVGSRKPWSVDMFLCRKTAAN